MKLTVSCARTAEEFAVAEELSKSRYSKDFAVDLAEIKVSSTDKFDREVIIVTNELNEIVGTSTMMYPVKQVLYPTEDLFGIIITRQIPDVASLRMVEVGRVAKSETAADGERIMNALMLATLEYLEINNLVGWIATVKKPMLRYLRKKGLKNMLMLENPPGYTPSVSPEVRGYMATNDVHYFMATLADTRDGFSTLKPLVEEGLIIFKMNTLEPQLS